jgi:hypothetical protein
LPLSQNYLEVIIVYIRLVTTINTDYLKAIRNLFADFRVEPPRQSGGVVLKMTADGVTSKLKDILGKGLS